MSQPIPASVNTNGTMLTKYVPAFTNYLTGPKLTEANAAGALDLSCYITGDGYNPDVNENTVDDPRLCQIQTFQSPGDYTRSLEITYVFNPKLPAADQARIMLTEGVSGFFLSRWAVKSSIPLAVGDIVDVAPFTAGVQRKQAGARNAVHRITQKLFITGTMAENIAMVA